MDWAHSLVLPCDVHPLRGLLHSGMIRATVLETMNEDYVRRPGKAPEALVACSYILQRAAADRDAARPRHRPPARRRDLHETVLGYQGLGRARSWRRTASTSPTVMGITVFATIAVIICNLIVDLLYAVIDPRIRPQARIGGRWLRPETGTDAGPKERSRIHPSWRTSCRPARP